ncbi:Aste57867_23923 [Aphanomyces stellatus]|uniref:Aste57867_23923 protein n=1 Tax=Aphanomyces stellatus TaxID=120398 RepID=A0A485LP38_9STRA|nr:hypothetical protein As57867_023850 [Aphanomyces stellatus]VFU00566.1 Aste57867_23923 [Aphanomyces stellatus]
MDQLELLPTAASMDDMAPLRCLEKAKLVVPHAMDAGPAFLHSFSTLIDWKYTRQFQRLETVLTPWLATYGLARLGSFIDDDNDESSDDRLCVVLDYAVYHGREDVVQFLHGRCSLGTYVKTRFLVVAVAGLQIDMLRSEVVTTLVPSRDDLLLAVSLAVSLAAYGNRTEMLRGLFEHYDLPAYQCSFNYDVQGWLTMQSSIDTLEWVMAKAVVPSDELVQMVSQTMLVATCNAKMDVLDWLVDTKGGTEPSWLDKTGDTSAILEGCLQYACFTNHVNVFHWIFEQLGRRNPPTHILPGLDIGACAIVAAATEGSLDMVEYFVALGCSVDATMVAEATQRGHTAVGKYLVDVNMTPMNQPAKAAFVLDLAQRTTTRCDEKVCQYALAVWLAACDDDKDDRDKTLMELLRIMAKEGRVRCVKHVHATMAKSCPKETLWSAEAEALGDATQHRQDQVMRWLTHTMHSNVAADRAVEVDRNVDSVSITSNTWYGDD